MTTRSIWRPLLIIGACFWLSSGTQAQVSGATVAREGAVKGRVLDENRAPVAKAEVYLGDQGLTIKAFRYVETDAAGYFRMDHVALGTYWVFAQKEDSGYPDQSFDFYNNSRSPKVTLTRSSPVKSVVVRVGPRCGKLATTITDAISGKAVDGALMLRRATDPRKYLGTNSSRPILIPSDTDIEVEVGAKGYVSWPPSTAKSTEGIIRVKPGEVYSLSVRLTPSKP